jgi:hypothetical protein
LKRKPFTEERREKVRAAMLGKRNATGKRSDQARRNISAGRRKALAKQKGDSGAKV